MADETKKIEDGGPAFPGSPLYPVGPSERGGTLFAEGCVGMSLRDWFAGQALAGMLAFPQCDGQTHAIAGAAYVLADAMLVARSRGGKG